MAHEHLYLADVIPGFQQVGGKAVTKGVQACPLVNPGFVSGLLVDATDRFIAEGLTKKLHGLKGHRSVGGIRASIYNAMPVEGVERLIDFMAEFKKNNS